MRASITAEIVAKTINTSQPHLTPVLHALLIRSTQDQTQTVSGVRLVTNIMTQLMIDVFLVAAQPNTLTLSPRHAKNVVPRINFSTPHLTNVILVLNSTFMTLAKKAVFNVLSEIKDICSIMMIVSLVSKLIKSLIMAPGNVQTAPTSINSFLLTTMAVLIVEKVTKYTVLTKTSASFVEPRTCTTAEPMTAVLSVTSPTNIMTVTKACVSPALTEINSSMKHLICVLNVR